MRITLGTLVVLAALAGAVTGSGAKITRTFEETQVGTPPAGFVFEVTRQATSSRWVVQREGGNSFLAHLGSPVKGGGFALALMGEQQHRNLAVAVRLRLAGGERSAGLVWHYRDAGNSYLARLDLMQQKIGLYRVVRSNRIRIESKDDLELDPDAWHVLKAVHDDDRIRVYLGGIKVFDAHDRTFPDSGSVGVWSSGESVTYFDDLRVEERDVRADGRP